MEFSMPNLNQNEVRYTEKEWEQIRQVFRPRVWGLKVVHVAREGGRKTYSNPLVQWLYKRDLLTLVVPVGIMGCMVLMLISGVALAVVL